MNLLLDTQAFLWLEKHFAPGLGGFEAVVELREAKLALESELAAGRAKLKDSLEDTRLRRH